jgi:hypothetical protein
MEFSNAGSPLTPPTLTSFLVYLYEVEKALHRKLGPVDCDLVAALHRKKLPVEVAVALLRQ